MAETVVVKPNGKTDKFGGYETYTLWCYEISVKPPTNPFPPGSKWGIDFPRGTKIHPRDDFGEDLKKQIPEYETATDSDGRPVIGVTVPNQPNVRTLKICFVAEGKENPEKPAKVSVDHFGPSLDGVDRWHPFKDPVDLPGPPVFMAARPEPWHTADGLAQYEGLKEASKLLYLLSHASIAVTEPRVETPHAGRGEDSHGPLETEEAAFQMGETAAQTRQSRRRNRPRG